MKRWHENYGVPTMMATMCPTCGGMEQLAPAGTRNEFVSHESAAGKPCPGVARTVRCGHCGRVCGDFDGGWASMDHVPLCHPNAPGRPDCYHMATTYRHPLLDCERCTQDPYEPLTKAELHDSLIDSLRRMEQIVRDAMP